MERFCDYIYESYTTGTGYGKRLVRCVPYDGVFIYEIGATYAKQRPCSFYYVFGRTEKEARNRFKSAYGDYMKIMSIVIVPEDKVNDILTDRLKIPL